MDIVVRTPHGDADICIVATPPAATLADLLQAVTGQAVPTTARIDGRAVATTRRLADIDLVIGSLVDARPEPEVVEARGSDDDAMGLVQLTGRGAGTTVRLPRGRFRIGTARRLHADELDRAPVEVVAFDLEVGPTGTRVRPGADIGGALGIYTPTLGAELFDRELQWGDERLDVGGRLFDLDVPFRPHQGRRLAAPADDGSIPFQRSGGAPSSRRRVVVDAVDDAMSGAGGLWSRRGSDPGAFDIPYGLHADGVAIASVDLQRHRGLALVGSDRFSSALARTLLVEVVTMHGPADLDVVIASTPERIARWNWAKWLPHVRQAGPTTPPNLLDEPAATAAWAASLSAPREGAGPRPVTLLVLDDISLWNRRDSPIRLLLVDPPPELRIMALCVGLHEAPGMCTSLLEEVPPIERLAHLASVTAGSGIGRPALFGSLTTQHTRLADAPHIVTDIRPALVEVSLAAEVARMLAPLDDLEAHHRLLPPPTVAPSLAELVELAVHPPAEDETSDSSLNVPIGVTRWIPGTKSAGRTLVTVDLTATLATIVVADDVARHDRTVAALLLGAAAQRPSGELAILIVGDEERPAWHSELPHIAGWASREEANDASRLIHRVAHVLTERPDLHVLIVIERAFDADDPMPSDLVRGMTELAESLPNVHLVLTGDHPDSVPEVNRARCAAFAWIDDRGAGRLWADDRDIAFDGLAPETMRDQTGGPTVFDPSELIIRPITHGRAMTPLERRLVRVWADASTPDGDNLTIAAVARQVAARTGDPSSETGPSLLPPPLPTAIDFAALLDRYPGDGVPIGLVDRPDRAESEAYWWLPGSGGSILAIGAPRSGMTSLIELVICGSAARVSADDLHIYAVEALPQRRRALDTLPHTGSVANPDEPDAVRRLISGLHRIHAERMETRTDTDRPNLLLLISDISRMVRSLPAHTLDATMQQLADIAASGPSVGINVIAIGSRMDDLDPLARLAGDRLVGITSDPADRTKLGAPLLGASDRHTGRCWSTAANRRVQLATPPASLDVALERLAPEAAQQLRPAQILPGGTS